jgi:hypothetical protein
MAHAKEVTTLKTLFVSANREVVNSTNILCDTIEVRDILGSEFLC